MNIHKYVNYSAFGLEWRLPLFCRNQNQDIPMRSLKEDIKTVRFSWFDLWNLLFLTMGNEDSNVFIMVPVSLWFSINKTHLIKDLPYHWGRTAIWGTCTRQGSTGCKMRLVQIKCFKRREKKTQQQQNTCVQNTLRKLTMESTVRPLKIPQLTYLKLPEDGSLLTEDYRYEELCNVFNVTKLLLPITWHFNPR